MRCPRLRPEVCAQVEAALFPAVLGLPTARVRAAARRAVAVADPDEVAEQAGAGPGGPVRPGPPRPRSGDERVGRRRNRPRPAWRPGRRSTSWRTAYVADGEHRSLEQARADAMIDLILGQATITTTVELNLPLERAAGSRPGHPRRRGERDPAGVGGSGGGCSCGAHRRTPAAGAVPDW